MDTLGSQLKARRLEVGLSQGEIAALAGIKPDHLRKIENGYTPYPRKATVDAIAAVLGCKVTVSVVAVDGEKS